MRSGSHPYVPAIDRLRAVAVGLVLAAHLVPGFTAGRVGVDIFFVISGYLIADILLAEVETRGSVDLVAFYVRRILRLMPPLLGVLLAHMLAWRVWVGLGASPTDLLIAWAASIGYFWNLLIVSYGGLPPGAVLGLGHLWSLAQEEQFYVFLPLAIGLISRRGGLRRWFPALMGSAALLTLALYVVGAGSITSEFSPWTRSIGLFLGCSLAGLRRLRPVHVSQTAACVCIALLAVVVADCQSGHFARQWDIPVAAICGLVVTAHLTSAKSPSAVSLAGFLRHPVMVHVGLLSYSIYLWHLPLIVVARDVLGWGPWATAAVVVPLTLLLALSTRRLVEIPAARLKERWVRMPLKDPAVQPSSSLPVPRA